MRVSGLSRRAPPLMGRRRALLASGRRFAPLSSRGLGRRALMPETRVRIPVAVLISPRVYGAFRVLTGSERRSERQSGTRGVCSPAMGRRPTDFEVVRLILARQRRMGEPLDYLACE